MKSIDMKLDLQKDLWTLIDSFEGLYYAIRKECMDEAFAKVEESVAQKDEMKKLYDRISDSESLRMSWIKSKLPWYIWIFNKISSSEMSLRGTSVFIGVRFGKSLNSNLYVEITPRDIGWFLESNI